MNLPEFSLRRPVTVVMLYASMLVLGAVSLTKMRVEWLPQVDIPQIYVFVPYANSHPQQIERDIVRPLEETFATLRRVKRMRSTAEADSATVELEFEWGEPIHLARLEVSEKAEQAREFLPDGVEHVFVYAFSSSDIPVLEARISAPGADLETKFDMLDARVKRRLERIPGVGRVDLHGTAPKEILIELNLDKIIEHGVDVSMLIGRLAALNADVTAGAVTDGGVRYRVRAMGGLREVEDYENVLVNARGLRLKDIAAVIYEEPALTYGRRLHREYAVAVSVYKESTANTVEVARAASRMITEEISRDPHMKGLDLFVFNDQAADITAGLNGLFQSGVFGGALAMAVLLLFLRRWKPSFIIIMAIPVSVIASCTILYFMGRTLNILSIMGLMLGVGMLVDNSIVVLENIYRRRMTIADAFEAARVGAREVGLAVTASTLTTVIVFLPLIVGKKSEITVWLSEVGMSLTLTILCSLLVSLTLVPLLAARMLTGDALPPGKIYAWTEARYRRLLEAALRRPLRTGAVALAITASALIPYAWGMKESGDPSGDEQGFQQRPILFYDFSDFRYKSQVERVVKAVEDFLYERQEEFGFESVYSYYEENFAISILTMKDKDMDEKRITAVKKAIRDDLPEFPGAEIGFRDFMGGGRRGAEDRSEFAVRLYGDDSDILRALALQAEDALAGVEGLEDVRASERHARDEIQVSMDRETSARHAITPEELSRIFYFTLGGQRLRRFNAGEREVDVTVGLRGEDRQNVESMRKMVVRSNEGRGVPLGDIADFRVAQKPGSIRRDDRKATLAVTAVYEGEDEEKARGEIRKRLGRIPFPTGYSWKFSEHVEREAQERDLMMENLLLALVLVYLLMAALFESFLHPFAILFTVPFALVGVYWFLALWATPFNIMAMIGVLILIGVVVNNGIVLLDRVNELRREGVAREEALARGCAERLRAVLMTALTTVLGLLPMALGKSGIGGAYYYPLARTVMGGLAFSTVLTLFFLPYLYVLLDKAAAWARTVRAGAGGRQAFSPAEETTPS